MKYLYITLYFFYAKILFVQRDYPPIISITAVLSLFVMFLTMILIEILNFQHLYHYKLLKVFFMIIYLLGWFLFYKYYLPIEHNLIKKFNESTKQIKTLTLVLSSVFIIIIIVVWFKRFDYFRE
jgi:hypothetical protein